MLSEVHFTPRAERDLISLPERDKKMVADSIEGLRENPRPQGTKKLAGGRDFFRLRVGNYRIVYQIQKRMLVVLVLRIGDRKAIYAILGRLRP